MSASTHKPQMIPLTSDDLHSLRNLTQQNRSTTGLVGRVLLRWAMETMPADELHAAVGDEIERAAERRREVAREAAAARWGAQKEEA